MLNMDLVTRPIPPIPLQTVPPRPSFAELPLYDEAITSDQGITARARIAPGAQNVLHHIDYSSDPEEARIHFELTSPTRRVRSRDRLERSPRRQKRRNFPENSGVLHYHYYQGDINVEQFPWMVGTTRIRRGHARTRQTPGGDDGNSPGDEGDPIPEREILVEANHMTVKDLKFLKEEELEGHLMGIQEVMDPQVMEDSPQDEVHLEEEGLQDHQEEDHLVHLETLDPQEIKDPQVPLDLKDIEDPKPTRTCRTTRPTRTNSWTTLCTWKSTPTTGNGGYIWPRKNFSWNGQCSRKISLTSSFKWTTEQIHKRTKKGTGRRKKSVIGHCTCLLPKHLSIYPCYHTIL